MSKKIKKILIANRGEIAIRVMKTCRSLGIVTVSLFRDDEVDLPHRLFADYSVGLGTGTLAETYLNIDKIIEIAKTEKVDAIHPGYGFLSENAKFAKALEENDIIFIGPTVDAITLMGDKKASKVKMEEVGVPLVPGYHGDILDSDFLKKEAQKIGYPVMIKASAGGGGKGMRIVNSEKEFSESLEAAKREAMNAFNDDKVLVEKYITSPRHIEVQVMSDTHGGHFHFFERECSIQRRHQKIVEETPSPALDEKIRLKMCDVAVKICKSINYRGAGTVEFIFDKDQNFYFLEMNTRLQVEHPITEMVTGADLVALQIQVAAGEKLSLDQNKISQRGHAIEVRLYAEDPDNDFMPSIGTIESIGEIHQNNTRLDTGYVAGNEVTINYDPMLAKLICWSPDRHSCIQTMIQNLEDVVFMGLKTNRNYLHRILKNSEFQKGNTYTNFVETEKMNLLPKENDEEEILAILAAKELTARLQTSSENTTSYSDSSWSHLNGFRN